MRTFGPWDGASVIIANVIGIGIFTTPGIIAELAPGLIPFFSLWIAGGLLALTGSFAYADLAALIPKAGGEYIYLRKSFGPAWGFLSGWTSFIAGFSGAIAASSVGFAEYFRVILPEIYVFPEYIFFAASWFPVHLSPEKFIAVCLILFVTLFHISKITVGGRFQNLLTLLNIFTILALVGLGFASNPGLNFSGQVSSGNFSFSFWFLALIPVMFTYSGWNAAVYIAEEIKNPGKNMHRALLAGTGAVLVLYLLLNILIAGTIPFETLADSIDVINTMSDILFGQSGMLLFSLVILTALLSSVSAMTITGPRIYFAMAQDKLFPSVFGSVHPGYHVPRRAILFQSAWAAILVLSGTFEQLLIYTGFSIMLFSGLSVLALLILDKRSRRVGLTPVKKIFYSLFVLVSFTVVLNAIFTSPKPSLAGLILIAAGLPVYRWYSTRHK